MRRAAVAADAVDPRCHVVRVVDDRVGGAEPARGLVVEACADLGQARLVGAAADDRVGRGGGVVVTTVVLLPRIRANRHHVTPDVMPARVASTLLTGAPSNRPNEMPTAIPIKASGPSRFR